MIENKYHKYYYTITSQAQSRSLPPNVKIENHHIIPKSLGGSDHPSNIAPLTLREHFVCHMLLVRMTEGKERTKMVYALWKMCHSTKEKLREFKLTARSYERVKSLVSKNRTSADFTPEWRSKISASRKGKSSWNKGIARTEDEKVKISNTRKQKAANANWNIRPPCSPETALKIKEANKGKRWIHNKTSKERKYIDPTLIEGYISLGWEFGLGPKN